MFPLCFEEKAVVQLVLELKSLYALPTNNTPHIVIHVQRYLEMTNFSVVFDNWIPLLNNSHGFLVVNRSLNLQIHIILIMLT